MRLTKRYDNVYICATQLVRTHRITDLPQSIQKQEPVQIMNALVESQRTLRKLVDEGKPLPNIL